MERRLLSAFLAVMMVLTMAPVAFAADTSVDSYDSLVEAINNAADGATITLSGDIDVQQTLVVTKKLTLNLAEHKLYNTKDLWDAPTDNNWSLISVRENGDLTITGNGTLEAKEDDCYAVDIQDADAKVTIENGTFIGNITAVYVHPGKLVIKGGSYSIKQLNSNNVQDSYGLTINCKDEDYRDGTAQVLITGGTFNHFNPVNNAAEGTGTNFATSGYETAEETDGSYTVQVKSDNAAVIDDVQYATLADAVAAAQGGATVKLLKDVTENVVIPAGKTVTLDLNGKNIKPETGCAIVNKGNLTVTGSGEVLASQTEMAAVANFPDAVINLNGGTYLSKYWYVLKNMGSMTIDGAVTVKPADSGNVSSLIDNGWYYPTDKVAGESVPAQADKASLTIKNGDFSGKSGEKSCSVVKNDDYGVLNISGGTFDSTTNTNATNAATILNWNIATISGGIFKGQYPISNGAFANAADKGEITISGGTFTGSKTLFGYGQGGDGVGKITITDGNFAAPAFGNWGSAYTMEISGGYFTTDPSDYVTGGLTGVPSNRTDKYVWTVGKKSETKAEVATGEPTVDTSNVTTNTDADKKLLEATKTALSSTEVEGNGIATAAAVVANNNTVTADTGVVSQLKEATKDNAVTAENTNIVIQTYMDMTITGVDASSEKKTITVDIQPMYRTVATTADVKNGGEIVLKGDESKAVNAVQIGDPQKLTVSGETTVSIQLPTGFVTDETAKIFVQHKGYEYEATVTKDENGVYTATFTNPHGFSPFTISMTSQAVAQIGETKYTSLQDAVNAVAANGTIEIIGGTSPYTGTANKTFTVSNKTSAEITVNGQTIKPTESYTFKYTPSSGSSSGGSSSGKTTYKVTTSAVNNGGVNASPSNAEKGATITITLSPDKGYKLDKLTVTDGSGKTVSTVKKSDTVYTFTMPASAVKVGVSYVKATETPSETKFNDVSANDWFASAVDYVTGKGMMNGTADNTFSPKANTTRGMVVTVLYRLENQPSTSAASFTDVASGAYYANAVAWANANGIVSGYGSGKFGPNDKVTREQLAAILYRYAQYKKYDVSVGEDTNILSYDDAQSISSYAIPAIQWACGAGVVTGKSGSKLDPKGNATRAEVAAMLMRFCENVK